MTLLTQTGKTAEPRRAWMPRDGSVPAQDDVERKARKGRKENLRSKFVGPFSADTGHGVETLMLRYPREGHGMRETQHIVDFLDRSMGWYVTHFQTVQPQRTN